LTKADGALDLNASAESLAARINGLYPWPGCTAEISGQVIKIGSASSVQSSSGNLSAPGTVLAATSDAVSIAAGAGVLELLKLQRPGGKMLPVADFLRGFPIGAGTVLTSRPMAPLVAREPFPYKKV
jgi:methionyl-tRNA formyltransferase